ncbi:pectate lyase, partial [Streptomyces sp. NEAU-H22]|nr:pectate lyase [Streptomyces sp. NEAU-H22]
MGTAKFVTRALLVSAVTAGSITMVPSSASASDAAAGNTYYVAPNGDDSAAGTLAAPWRSIARAQAVATAGDTVY